MSIEFEVANQIVHRERIAAQLRETGGEQMYPDHYAVREAIRNAVLVAIDEVTSEREIPRMSDAELPDLFRALDAIANRVFLKSVGLNASC